MDTSTPDYQENTRRAPNNEFNTENLLHIGTLNCPREFTKTNTISLFFGGAGGRRERGKEKSITHYLQEICWKYRARNGKYH